MDGKLPKIAFFLKILLYSHMDLTFILSLYTLAVCQTLSDLGVFFLREIVDSDSKHVKLSLTAVC